MKNMKNNFEIAKLTKQILDIVFFIAPVIWLLLPVLFYYMLVIKYNVPMLHYVWFSIIFMCAGILVWLIIYELRNMLASVILQNPFIERNVVSLKRMSIYGFAIAVLMILTLICFLNISTMLLSMVFFIAGLFSYVLSQVFHEAIVYKQENDLTI